MMTRLSSPAEDLKDHDEVVVIGSGYGGAIAASRLSRAGRQVCLLDRGRSCSRAGTWTPVRKSWMRCRSTFRTIRSGSAPRCMKLSNEEGQHYYFVGFKNIHDDRGLGSMEGYHDPLRHGV
ncbi:MAG: NAD(P)-binding protein [Pseudonocardiaceae bacterium]